MMMPVQGRRLGRRRQRTLGSSSRLAVASTTMLAKYSASSLAGVGISANAPDGSRVGCEPAGPGSCRRFNHRQFQRRQQRWRCRILHSDERANCHCRCADNLFQSTQSRNCAWGLNPRAREHPVWSGCIREAATEMPMQLGSAASFRIGVPRGQTRWAGQFRREPVAPATRRP